MLPRDGNTYHSGTQQTKLRAHQSSVARLSLRGSFYGHGHGHDDGCCEGEYDDDLTAASPQISCPFARAHAADGNGWP